MLCEGVVPHVVGDSPVAVGLPLQNVEEGSSVRGASGLAALCRRPGDFIGAPGVGELAVAADTLQCYNELGDFRGRGVWREPEIVQSFESDAGFAGVRWKEHAIVGEQGADDSVLLPR